MTKVEWGMKRVCTSCGARFYDLTKIQPICPECGFVCNFSIHSKPTKKNRGAFEQDKIANLDLSDELVEDKNLKDAPHLDEEDILEDDDDLDDNFSGIADLDDEEEDS